MESGLQLVVNPDSRLPLIAVHLRVGVGAASDPPARPGRAHLAEHLAFPDGDAATTHDAMSFRWRTDPEGLPEILSAIRARLSGTCPPPTPQAVAIQAAVAQRELIDLGDLRAQMRAEALYPPGHPYRWPAAGTAEGLALWGADPEGVADFLSLAFRPDGAVLVLSGALGPAEIAALSSLDDLAAQPPLKAPLGALPTPRAGATTQVAGVASLTQVAIWPGVREGDPDEAALDLVASLLQADRRRGLRASALSRTLGGELVVLLPWRARPSAAVHALDRALRALRRPQSAEAMARALAPWERWAADAGEGLDERAALIADCLARSGVPDCREGTLARHRAVTSAEIRAVIDRYLSPERRMLLQMVPPGGPVAAPR